MKTVAGTVFALTARLSALLVPRDVVAVHRVGVAGAVSSKLLAEEYA
jgi:hypothetical protein